MADTYAQIWNRVLLRAPDVGPFIAQDFVRNAWRRLQERRSQWSWQVKYSQWIAPTAYTTGTVAATQGSTTITGTATAWTADLLYRQFRIGVVSPIYTITAIDVGAQTLTLDFAYGGATVTGSTYRIIQCFFPVPEDFRALITVWDPQNNWQLRRDVKQEELNMIDPQRSNSGQAWLTSFRDVSTNYTGYTSGPGVSRYELWPHPVGYTFPYLYEAEQADLDDGGVIPRSINGDLLLEMALAEAAYYPGTRDKPNSYFSKPTGARHDERAEQLIAEAELKDDDINMQDLLRQYNVPGGYAVPWGDAQWLQSHLT